MSHRYGEQGTEYGQTYEESNKSTAYNNLPLSPGDDGANHFGKGPEGGNVTYALMLAFNYMRRNAGLRSLAFVRLVRWNGGGETNDRIAVTFGLRLAKKCRWRLLCASRGACITIRDRRDHGDWHWQQRLVWLRLLFLFLVRGVQRESNG